ncbi:MAG: chemotaxis response regulator protein-glutamate methylesterase [Bacteroidales bacterium]|nr:chemotaxis response regulator protein-glutamate methylesterase [Bacteroidales bacterium]
MSLGNKKIRVLIVDDSAVVRQTMSQILQSDPDIEIMATACDPYIAAKRIQSEVPDVITLDVEMPRMDGITFLKKIMTQHPIPVLILSSLTDEGSRTALKALEYGAVDVIAKPRLDTKQFIEDSKHRLIEAVKAAAHAKVVSRTPQMMRVEPKLSADAVIAKSSVSGGAPATEVVVAVGASTGGTEALRVFLEAMPTDCPGIVIVQHMPENFTKSFADRLNDICRISVKEAENGDQVRPGHALIAPGNKHTLLKRNGVNYYVEVKDGPLVNRHRPSVDVLFRSTARYAGSNAIGIIMTGMGDDGAKGLLEMKEAGAKTAAQDEATCVVYGMPKEAVKLGAADKILPLEKLAQFAVKPF